MGRTVVNSTSIDKHTRDIQRLYAFGSVLTSPFNNASDIDDIVNFEPQDIDHYADNFFNLKFALEDTFNRKIDVLEEKAIKNPYLKQVIESKRQLIYGN